MNLRHPRHAKPSRMVLVTPIPARRARGSCLLCGEWMATQIGAREGVCRSCQRKATHHARTT